jgi:hypothetical protein
MLLRLTLNLLMTTIVAPPSNASKWQIEFNSAFKGLMVHGVTTLVHSVGGRGNLNRGMKLRFNV